MNPTFDAPKALNEFYQKILDKKNKISSLSSQNKLGGHLSRVESSLKEIQELAAKSEISRLHDLESLLQSAKMQLDLLKDSHYEGMHFYLIGDQVEDIAIFMGQLVDDIKFKLPTYDYPIKISYQLNGHNTKVMIIKSKTKEFINGEDLYDYMERSSLNYANTQDNIDKNYQTLINKYPPNDSTMHAFKKIKNEAYKISDDRILEIVIPIQTSKINETLVMTLLQGLTEELINLCYDVDCLLYLISPEKMYFQKEEVVQSFILKYQTLGILVDDSESQLKEAKGIFKKEIEQFFRWSRTSEDFIDEITQEVSHLSRHYTSQMLMDRIYATTDNIVYQLYKDMKSSVRRLKVNLEKRNTMRAAFRDDIQKETQGLENKMDWMISNFLLNVGSQIKLKAGDLLDLGQNLPQLNQYVLNEILDKSNFIKEVYKLREILQSTLKKVYDKQLDQLTFKRYPPLDIKKAILHEETLQLLFYEIRNDFTWSNVYDWSSASFFDNESLNKLLNPTISKTSILLAFMKKKRVIALQEDLQNYCEDSMKEVKRLLKLELDASIQSIYDKIYANIDGSFEALYCKAIDVPKVIRLIGEASPVQKTRSKLTIQDIIMSHSS